MGFGRSPAPPDAAYDVDCHVRHLLSLVDEPVVIVGHSTGGVIAAALATRLPELVRHLVLVGLPAFPDEVTAREEIGRLGLLARLTAEGRGSARWLCQAMCRLKPLAVALAPMVIRDLPPSVASDAARHTWLSYRRTLERLVLEHRCRPDVLAGRSPVSLVHGDRDRTAPPAHVLDLHGALMSADRQTTLSVIAGGDHHVAVRRPRAVGPVVMAAVQRPPL